MEERMTDVEIHLAHLERDVRELNDLVYRQQQAVDRLEGEVRRLREQLLTAVPSISRAPEEEEPPPHY